MAAPAANGAAAAIAAPAASGACAASAASGAFAPPAAPGAATAPGFFLRSAHTARCPRPGAKLRGGLRRRARGFTLLELLLVLALIGVASGGAVLALRDSAASALEREGQRLQALLETGRAQSRVRGVVLYWRPSEAGFVFSGWPLPAPQDALRPRDWLSPGTAVRVLQPAGAVALVLGPEPVIGPQQLELRLGAQRLRLGTDGIRPFAVLPPNAP